MMMISQLASCHFKKDVLLNLSSQALHKIDVEVSLLLNFGASGGGRLKLVNPFIGLESNPTSTSLFHWTCCYRVYLL